MSVEYTEQEIADLGALRALRRHDKDQLRSGNPSVVAKAQVHLNAVELEVRKIHRAAELRARLKEGLASLGVKR
jgi:hypothetical protein